MEKEVRSTKVVDETEVRYQPLEVETRSENNEMIVEGYAVVFNKPADLGAFKEVVEQRALDNVDLSDVKLLYNHNTDNILGSTKAGTLSLTTTSKGLHFRASLPNTTLGKDVFELVKRGDLQGMSFGFQVAKDAWDVRSTPEIRKIQEIRSIPEITITAFPAYKDTIVSTRSLEHLNECKECRIQEENSKKLLEEAKAILEEIVEI